MPEATVSETHISTVFFTTDRAYKLLKPLRTGFLDHSDAEVRCEAARREVELNRRLAPDVYLGTADVVEEGRLVDRFVVMRRLPSDRRLSALVGRAEFADQVRAVARTVASFHASRPPLTDPDGPAAPDAVATLWSDNLAEMEPFAGRYLDPDTLAEIADRSGRYLAGREALLEQRVATGHVRDGHGDLLADDIFCLDDGPRILDCLAFRDDLRISDVLLDIAFLVMDLDRIAGPAMARDLMHWYQEFSNEHHPASLAHFYVAYRALVRAKVSCLAAEGGAPGAERDARLLLGLCAEHLRRAAVRLVLVGGGPGSGKSTVAEGLCDRYGWNLLASDELRKDLTGVSHDEHAFAAADQGIYDPRTTELTYRTLVDEARRLLELGHSVVLDASWTTEDQRALARRAAADASSDLVAFECVLDADIAAERVSRRLATMYSPSDATPDIALTLSGRRDEWPEAMPLDTAHPPEDVVDAAAHAIGR